MGQIDIAKGIVARRGKRRGQVAGFATALQISMQAYLIFLNNSISYLHL